MPHHPAPSTARLLIVPGLHDSGPAHWQTWLHALHPGSVRVVQDDWLTPDVTAWSARIEQTLAQAGPGPWVVAAHSFGCLALAHLLGQRDGATLAGGRATLQAALLVAPAEPGKFGIVGAMPAHALPLTTTLIASETDPWMRLDSARRWAIRWGSRLHNLGDAGHVNAESGYGPWPLARRWVQSVQQRQAREQRPVRADLREWSFAS